MPKPQFKHEAERREIINDLKELDLHISYQVLDADDQLQVITIPLRAYDDLFGIIAGYILEREDQSNA